MSDFNLLGFLNINVPNEPLTPIIPNKKESYKILTPSSKPDDSNSTPKSKKSPEQNGKRTPELGTSEHDNTSTPKHGKHSPFYRTSYEQAFGTSEPPSVPLEETPSTPSSVSSVSSTISQCEDPECDDCLNRQEQEDKKALAARERELERLDYELANKKRQDEIVAERQKFEEKKEKDKKELEADRERVRAERAAARAQKQQEDAEEAAMRKELSKIDESAIEEANARNREYAGALQSQIEDDRARRIAQEELNRQQSSSGLSFGADEAARQERKEAAQREMMQTLDQQIADRRAEGRAEHAAEIEELRRRHADEEAIYQAKKAEEAERNEKMKEGFRVGNRDAIEEKRAREQAAAASDRDFQLAQIEQNRRAMEEERRLADERKRAELEALHQQLAAQVARRREQLRQAREEDKAFLPTEVARRKEMLIHCGHCDKDLPSDRFSNYVITPNGKVYKRSKAAPKNSPLHKYLRSTPEATAGDFGHNYS